MGVNGDQLAAVRRAARRRDEAQAALVARIRDARGRGHSLRAIGGAAGLSHEQVRNLLARG